MPKPTACAILLLAPMLLLGACTTPVAVQPPQRPALPAQARQPPLPSWCETDCLEKLTRQRESWRRQLEKPEPPGLPASGSMK